MKEIVRLLRFIGNGGCRLDGDEGEGRGCWRLSRPAGGVQAFSSAAVDEAESRGLVLRREGRLYATMEARSFVRRYLAAREEAFLDQHRVIEIAEAESGWTVCWNNEIAATFAETAAALAYARRLSAGLQTPGPEPRIRVYFTPRTPAL